jgi:CheY-like chemotaxis protein
MYAAYSNGHFSNLQGLRILVVEDEALVSMLVEEELLDAGALVIGPACSLDEALRLIETAVADGGLSAAVLDINLAGVAVWPAADRLAALGVPFVLSAKIGKALRSRRLGCHHPATDIEGLRLGKICC